MYQLARHRRKVLSSPIDADDVSRGIQSRDLARKRSNPCRAGDVCILQTIEWSPTAWTRLTRYSENVVRGYKLPGPTNVADACRVGVQAVVDPCVDRARAHASKKSYHHVGRPLHIMGSHQYRVYMAASTSGRGRYQAVSFRSCGTSGLPEGRPFTNHKIPPYGRSCLPPAMFRSLRSNIRAPESWTAELGYSRSCYFRPWSQSRLQQDGR